MADSLANGVGVHNKWRDWFFFLLLLLTISGTQVSDGEAREWARMVKIPFFIVYTKVFTDDLAGQS